MPFLIVHQDITKMHADAIVNAANGALCMGGGVCGAIFRAAGEAELTGACSRVSPVETGKAAVTPGFALPARYIIHAVGPVYEKMSEDESERLLRSAYAESLRLADGLQCESIAFPLISGGIYGYPKEKALSIAASEIRAFLSCHEMTVYLVMLDKASFVISRILTGGVGRYLEKHFIKARSESWFMPFEGPSEANREYSNAAGDALPTFSAPRHCQEILDSRIEPLHTQDVGRLIDDLDEPFSATLLRLIDAKGRTDVEVYKRANIDRKLFSKIRTGKGYLPSKRTVLALALALELSLKETNDLLQRAGYALSHSQKFDVIVEYFIVCAEYDLVTVNEVLFQYDQPLLGG